MACPLGALEFSVGACGLREGSSGVEEGGCWEVMDPHGNAFMACEMLSWEYVGVLRVIWSDGYFNDDRVFSISGRLPPSIIETFCSLALLRSSCPGYTSFPRRKKTSHAVVVSVLRTSFTFVSRSTPSFSFERERIRAARRGDSPDRPSALERAVKPRKEKGKGGYFCPILPGAPSACIHVE